MAPRSFSIITGTLLCSFVIVPLLAVWRQADASASLGPAEWAALRFTILQAFLSALLSCFLALPVARALSRTQFPGRRLVIKLMGAPFILPVIVAILGLLAVFGQNGWLNAALRSLEMGSFSIYGLHGVLIAHVFFNLPLATRLILLGWATIPQERFRLAQHLALTPSARFRLIEWPMLRVVLPSAFAVIFVICLSSFAVALTLGGGPKSTTLELAIYQAFRFELDFAKVALLGLIQLGLSLSAAILALRIAHEDQLGIGFDRPIDCEARSVIQKFHDTLAIFLALMFLGIPLFLVLANGLSNLSSLPVAVWMAALRSVLIALGATVLCLLLALCLLSRSGEVLATLGIAVSPLLLGTGLFLIARPFLNPFDISLIVTLCVNALMSLPFAVRILRPEMIKIVSNFSRLSLSLGFSYRSWVRWVVWPRLRRPLGFAAGLTAALSVGDLGVIALFGDAERATLPFKLYQLMGSYRTEQAAGCASLLLILSFSFFWIFDFWGRSNA